MEESTPTRPMRSDARRNRERLLEAARQVFGTGGAEASLEAVAQHAGLGTGTLYRHFPTREDLFVAVYRHEVDQLSVLAEQLARDAAPTDAIRTWLRANVQFIATKRGMAAALAFALDKSSDITICSFEQLTKALGSLLQRASAAREIRADIGAEDLLRTVVGMCVISDEPGWQTGALRMVDVLVDGLRAPQSAALTTHGR